MARIRQLKPEFWTDDKIAGLSRDARLLFLGLLTEADDDGRLVDSAKLLAGSLFPFDDDVTPKKLNGWLEEIIRTGRVRRYARGAASYLYIVNFKRHQKIAHPRRSSLPDPDDCPPSAGGTREDVPNDAPDPPAERAPDLGVKGSRGQGVKGVGVVAPPGGVAKRATGPPESFPLDDELRAWAGEHTPTICDERRLLVETDRFLDHHRAKGSTFKDWRAAWRTWMSRAVDYEPQPLNGARRVSASQDAITRVFAQLPPELNQ